MAVQQTSDVDALGCRTFFSGLISTYVIDILRVVGASRFVGTLHPLSPSWLWACLFNQEKRFAYKHTGNHKTCGSNPFPSLSLKL